MTKARSISPQHRHPGGKIMESHATPRKETAEQIMAVAKAQPHRAWLPDAAKRTHLAESPIGRLLLTKQISRRQYAAAELFRAKSMAYYRVFMGMSPTAPKSADLEVGGGSSCVQEPDDEQVFAIRREWSDMMNAISDAGHLPDAGVLTSVLVKDRECPPEKLGALRCMLNSLASMWRIPHET